MGTFSTPPRLPSSTIDTLPHTVLWRHHLTTNLSHTFVWTHHNYRDFVELLLLYLRLESSAYAVRMWQSGSQARGTEGLRIYWRHQSDDSKDTWKYCGPALNCHWQAGISSYRLTCCGFTTAGTLIPVPSKSLPTLSHPGSSNFLANITANLSSCGHTTSI